MKLEKQKIEIVMQIYDKIIASLDEVLIGQKEVKRSVASSILCDTNSRILLTGDPGMGKTTLNKFLANNFHSKKMAIFFDTLPSEIQELLKDCKNLELLQIEEFNRASERLQNVFIELFADNQITIGKNTYEFGDFYVVATQNNSETAGIFNVSQAIYDRFDVSISYKNLKEEESRELLFSNFTPSYKKSIEKEEIVTVKNIIDSFNIDNIDIDIMMNSFKIVKEISLNNRNLLKGDLIRANKFAIKLIKLSALASGRDYILPSDIVDFIDCLYMHRIDQSIASIEEVDVKKQFEVAKEKVLDLKRPKR